MTLLRCVLGYLLLSVVIATTAGCDDEKAAKCHLGEVLDCTCPNKVASVRACRPDGSWAGCQCTLPVAGSGAGMMGSAGTMAGMGGMSGMGASGMVADASTPDGGSSDATTGSDAMTDGAMPGEDGAVTAAYSKCDPGCPADQQCAATGNYCTKSCATMTDCADAPDGTATKTCGGLPATCTLSCDFGATCPTGMKCTGLVIGMTCTW